MNASEAKLQLRPQLLARLRSLPAPDRAVAAAEIVERFIHHPQWRAAKSVLLFSPLRDEPEISPLLQDAIATGKLVALPRFNPALGVYETAQLTDRAQLSPPGPFGVREPWAACPAVPVNQLDLALVPGIAFDPSGRRLGRGKGFYDRLLAGFGGIKCGVAFDAQVVAALPHEPHDVTLNCLMTPTRWMEFPSTPRL